MIKRFGIRILVGVAAFWFSVGVGKTSSATAGQFVILSDLHFIGEIEDGPGFSQYGQDSNRRLLQAVLEDVHKRCANPMFILCLGDFYAHNKLISGAKQVRGELIPTETILPRLIQEFFTNTTVFPVLGNNDASLDYAVPGEELLTDFAHAWAPLMANPEVASNFCASFASHGRFSVRLPGMPLHRLVGFNSTYMSAKNRVSPIEGTQQLLWLDSELSKAESNKETVWLAFHIPPGLDPHNTLASGTDVPLWQRELQLQLLKVWSKHSGSIAACFCGHTHMDDFRVLYSATNPMGFIHIAPSVSPCYGNNPAYQVFTTDAEGNIEDFETWYLTNLSELATTCSTNKDEWTMEYSFREAYQFQSRKYDTHALHELLKTLAKTDVEFARSNFIRFYRVSRMDNADVQPGNFETRFLPLMTLQLSAGKATQSR